MRAEGAHSVAKCGYFYGTNSGGILQIVDRDKLLRGPKEPTPENLLYPQVGRLDLAPNVGAHTVFPLLGMDIAKFARDKDGRARDFVVVTDEALTRTSRKKSAITSRRPRTRPTSVAS